MKGRGAATHQASQCGAALVPALVEIIVGRDELGHSWGAESRRGAVIALRLMGLQATPAKDVLVSLLTDDLEVIQSEAASALGCLGPAAQTAVPALVERLKSVESHLVCAELAEALASIAGEQAVVGLIAVLMNEGGIRSNSGRVAAATVLGKLGGRARQAIPALTSALADAHPVLRSRAAAALQLIAPHER